MTVKPWIQSLLLTSGHNPIISPSSLEVRADLSPDNKAVGKLISPSASSLPAGFNIQTASSTTQTSVGRPLGEVVNEHGIFWPLTQYVRQSRIEMLGNGCIVPKFPVRISFVLSAIVCGTGNVEFSWVIEEMSEQSGSASELLASSSSRSLHWHGLAMLAPSSTVSSLQMAMVKEPINMLVEHKSFYFIIAKLDGVEHGRIPLSVMSV